MAYYSRNSIWVRAYELDSRLILHKPLPKLYPPDYFHDITLVAQGNRIVQFDHVLSPELQPINHNDIPWANLLPARIREIADTGLNTIIMRDRDKYAAYIFQTQHQGLQLRFSKLLACVLFGTYTDHLSISVVVFNKGWYDRHYLATYKKSNISSICARGHRIWYRYLHCGDYINSFMIFGDTLTKIFITGVHELTNSDMPNCSFQVYRPSIGSARLRSNGQAAYDHKMLFAAKWMLVARSDPLHTEQFYSVGELYVSRSVRGLSVNTFTIIVPSSKSCVLPVLIATTAGDKIQFMRIHQTQSGSIKTMYQYDNGHMHIREIPPSGESTTEWSIGDLCSMTRNDRSTIEQCTTNIAHDVTLPHAEYYGQMPAVPESISIVHEIYRAKNIWPPKIRDPPARSGDISKICAGSNCRYTCVC